MLPARSRDVGMAICFPDVCLTPPAGVPVPYVNLGMNANAVPFAVKTYLSCVNALNMGSIDPMTMGDQSGAMSPFMGPGMVSLGNPKIFVELLPATNLLCPATGNNMIASLGAVLVPSVTNVFFTYATKEYGLSDPLPGASPDLLAELSRALAPSSARAEGMLPGEVVYFKVAVFSTGVPARVHDLLRRAPDARALVLDLRGCPGGELLSAVELASDFLPEGAVIATVTDPEGDETVYRSQRERPHAVPLVLLVDRFTASAAEVFAGSLKAHGRAVVAGERTFGKGSAQAVLPGPGVPGSAAAYATVATVTLPDGAPLHERGVLPDVDLPSAGEAVPRSPMISGATFET